jgi:uncharacterized membrane protein
MALLLPGIMCSLFLIILGALNRLFGGIDPTFRSRNWVV